MITLIPLHRVLADGSWDQLASEPAVVHTNTSVIAGCAALAKWPHNNMPYTRLISLSRISRQMVQLRRLRTRHNLKCSFVQWIPWHWKALEIQIWTHLWVVCELLLINWLSKAADSPLKSQPDYEVSHRMQVSIPLPRFLSSGRVLAIPPERWTSRKMHAMSLSSLIANVKTQTIFIQK